MGVVVSRVVSACQSSPSLGGGQFLAMGELCRARPAVPRRAPLDQPRDGVGSASGRPLPRRGRGGDGDGQRGGPSPAHHRGLRIRGRPRLGVGAQGGGGARFGARVRLLGGARLPDRLPDERRHRDAGLGAHPPAGARPHQADRQGAQAGSVRWGSPCAGSTARARRVMGNLFQISNQTTLGISERETIESLERSPGRSSTPRSGRASAAAGRPRADRGQGLARLRHAAPLRGCSPRTRSSTCVSAVRFGRRARRCRRRDRSLDPERAAGPHPAGAPAAHAGASSRQPERTCAPTRARASRRVPSRSGGAERLRGGDSDMHDKFTERVRKVMYLAREEAARLQHDYIGTEHLLLGVIREGEGIAATVLNNLGLDLDAHPPGGREHGARRRAARMTIGEIPFTPRAKRVLELAVEEARLARPQLRRHRAPAARPDPRGRGRRGARCCSSSASTASGCARRR